MCRTLVCDHFSSFCGTGKPCCFMRHPRTNNRPRAEIQLPKDTSALCAKRKEAKRNKLLDSFNMTPNPSTEGEPLRVVYAGFGRTGTHSLDAALERLGYKAVHGEDIARDILGEHKDLAEACIKQDIDKILEITSQMGYNATLEIHGMYWREIMERRPDAKYIFMLRDFDSWFESMVQTCRTSKPIFRYPIQAFPMQAKIARLLAATTAQELNVSIDQAWNFFLHPEAEAHWQVRKAAYDKYKQEALQITTDHPGQALLFHLQDGYAPLCEFLQVDNCPVKEPFPRVSTRSEMILLEYFLRAFEAVMYALPILVLLMAWRLVGHRRKGTKKHEKQKDN